MLSRVFSKYPCHWSPLDPVLAMLLGLMLLLPACSAPQNRVFELDSIRIDCSDLLSEAQRDVYAKTPPEERADEALKNLIVRGLVLQAPPAPEEEEKIAALSLRKAQRRCIELGMRREMGKRWDLEEECRKAFAEHPEDFRLPESFRLQMIFLSRGRKKAEKLSRELLAEIRRNPESFAELARKYSEGENAASGGLTRPMPGSALDPELRAAISAHADDHEAFLFRSSRGLSILRVLEYWPSPGGTFEQLSPKIQEIVSHRLMAQLESEIRARVEAEDPIRIRKELFLLPRVEPERICMNVDGKALRLQDLQKVSGGTGPISGPALAVLTARYRARIDAARYFDCSKVEPEAPTDIERAALRMESFLEEKVSQGITKELEDYFRIHHAAFLKTAEYRLEFWIFPFGHLAPFEARKAHRAAMDRVLSGKTPAETRAAEDDLIHVEDIVLSDAGLRNWAPEVEPLLKDLDTGVISAPIRSIRLRADILLRLKEKIPARPMRLEAPEDRGIILRAFIRDSVDDILQKIYEEACATGKLSKDALSRCQNKIAAGQETSS